MPKALVTGCTGLVGQGICKYLLDKGFEVWGSSRKKILSRHPSFKPVNLFLEKEDSVYALKDIIQEMDLVVLNAAKLPEATPDPKSSSEEFFQVNVIGTKTFLSLLSQNQAQRTVVISGTAFVKNDPSREPVDMQYLPKIDYYATRIIAEILFRQALIEERVQGAILRVCAPYGYISSSRKAVIPRFLELAFAGENITLWGKGKREQQFTFVEDIGFACKCVLDSKENGIFNILGPKPVQMKELAETIVDLVPNCQSTIEYLDKSDPLEGNNLEFSMENSACILKYQPQHSLSEGLSKIIAAQNTNDINFFELQN